MGLRFKYSTWLVIQELTTCFGRQREGHHLGNHSYNNIEVLLIYKFICLFQSTIKLLYGKDLCIDFIS